MVDVREALMVARTSDGRTVRRPLSPHLQIYNQGITGTPSIMHRITGVGLAVGTLLLVWWLVAAATSESAYAAVSWFMSSWIGYLALFCWTAALWYHFCNGIRHLFWDFGYGFELKTAHSTAKLVIGAAVVLTVLTWIILVATL